MRARQGRPAYFSVWRGKETAKDLLLPLFLPGPNYFIKPPLNLRTQILSPRMGTQPGHRFPNTLSERLAATKPGHEPFDFRVVKHSGMNFVPFQIARQLRHDL